MLQIVINIKDNFWDSLIKKSSLECLSQLKTWVFGKQGEFEPYCLVNVLSDIFPAARRKV